MITIRTNSAFTLWTPTVHRVQLGHAEDFRIMRADGTWAAYQCGPCIGVFGHSDIHRMGRKDA